MKKIISVPQLINNDVTTLLYSQAARELYWRSHQSRVKQASHHLPKGTCVFKSFDVKPDSTLSFSTGEDGTGVNFSTNPSRISPHVRAPHAETVDHVLHRIRGKAVQSHIFQAQDGIRFGVAVSVVPVPLKTAKVEWKETKHTAEGFHQDVPVLEATINGTDHYRISKGDNVDEQKAHMVNTDRVVTRAMLEAALNAQFEKAPEASGHIDVLVLNMSEGLVPGSADYFAKYCANWPYLTDEAMTLVSKLGVKNLFLSPPSADKENDNGLVGNHKIFFNNPNSTKVIVEMVESAHIHDGFVLSRLNIQDDHCPEQGCVVVKPELLSVSDERPLQIKARL